MSQKVVRDKVGIHSQMMSNLEKVIEKDIILNQYSDEQKSQYIKSKSKEEIFKEYNDEIKKRQIWACFDEINTCNSMR